MKYTAEENRMSWRFPKHLKGFYYLDEVKGEGKECTIINISINGAGLEFYTSETVTVKSKLYLEIFPLDGRESVAIEGKIRWVKQGRKDCVCGVQLTEKLNKAKMETLRM